MSSWEFEIKKIEEYSLPDFKICYSMENSGDLTQFLGKFTEWILRYGAPKLLSGFSESKSEENDIFGQNW